MVWVGLSGHWLFAYGLRTCNGEQDELCMVVVGGLDLVDQATQLLNMLFTA